MLPKAKTLLKDSSDQDQGSAEVTKLHVVKHQPKSEEEILDELVQDNSEITISMRKATNDAKTRM